MRLLRWHPLTTPAALVALAALASVALGGGACAGPRVPPPPVDVLGPAVDSVVVRPFVLAPRVALNDVDLALFQRHLRQALEDGGRIRSFDTPPTRLPNTVLISARVERADVAEREAPGLYLRTIELAAELAVHPARRSDARSDAQSSARAGPRAEPATASPGEPAGEAAWTLRGEVAWQKIYAGGPVSGLALDLEDAVRELAGVLARALDPAPLEAPLALRDDDGRDAALARGNRHAAEGKLRHAKLAWQHALFDPAPRADEDVYQVSALTLNHLRAAGQAEPALERLETLTALEPLPLPAFRERLHEALEDAAADGAPDLNALLPLTEARASATHRTLAAAHENLGTVYALEARGDLAAYHWARAWAHDPDPELLQRWRGLQARRNVLPRTVSDREALTLYLRIPPPTTARIVPGRFERTVLPPPAFPEAAPPAPEPPSPREGSAASAAARAVTPDAERSSWAPPRAIASRAVAHLSHP
jgi:hypothetical protein